MTALKARLDETRDGLSIPSTLTEAINYTLNHWAGLILFLDDGRLEPGSDFVWNARSDRLASSHGIWLFCSNKKAEGENPGQILRRSFPRRNSTRSIRKPI